MSDVKALAELLGGESVSVLIHATTNLAAAAQHKFGVAATTEELLEVQGLKELVLADRPLDVGECLDQLQSVKTYADKLVLRRNDSLARECHAENMRGLSRSERMNYARQHPELSATNNKSEQLSDAEFLQIAAGLSPAKRMAFAREHGRG